MHVFWKGCEFLKRRWIYYFNKWMFPQGRRDSSTFLSQCQCCIRREMNDMKEVAQRRVAGKHYTIAMKSGSLRERFILQESDMDNMFWQNDERVIWDMYQIQFYSTFYKNVNLSDSSESSPGFTLLELLTPQYTKRPHHNVSQWMTDTVYLVLYTVNKNIHLNLLALQNMDPVRVVNCQ